MKKSLYGLKQTPRQWYKNFDSFMVGHGYQRTAADYCVYFKQFLGEKFIILLLYVDDMLIVGHDRAKISKLKEKLAKSFDRKDLSPVKQILGMEITRDRKNRRLWLSQESYVERILERFNMKKAKPVTTPLGGHFKLIKKSCPSTEEKKEGNDCYSIFVNSWKPHVCYGLYTSKHSSCNWSSKQIFGKSW